MGDSGPVWLGLPGWCCRTLGPKEAVEDDDRDELPTSVSDIGWEEVNRLVHDEPAEALDPELAGQQAAIGIVKAGRDRPRLSHCSGGRERPAKQAPDRHVALAIASCPP
jgi:hypothetical protein